MTSYRYRITSRRWDDRGPAGTHSEPSFEGIDTGSCDDKARDHFNRVTAEPANSWDRMCLLRIDAPATSGPERTTFLAKTREPSGDGDALDFVG